MITVSTKGCALCVCCLIRFLLQPFTLSAQAELMGWGPYQLGQTTPDSLVKKGFREEAQPLVKGTIALSCSHIRIFQADTILLGNLTVTNVSLAFYDNKLFKLACDGNATVRQSFSATYGAGMAQPLDTVKLCKVGKLMVIEREVWQHKEINALFIRVKGYSPHCQLVTDQQLIIVNQRVLALTSECEMNDEYLLPKQ